MADLMVVSPAEKKMFLVDVKGLSRPNPWIVTKKAQRDNLFYILAHVPTGKPNQFFILTQQQVAQVQAAQVTEDEVNRPPRKIKSIPRFPWRAALPYEDAWTALPK